MAPFLNARTPARPGSSNFLTVLAAACVCLPACDTLDWLGPEDEMPIQTEELAYELTPDWIGLSVDIPYMYANSTGRRVYLVNCNGSFAVRLNREVNGEWVTAWAPVLDACLSHPIVVEPNATFADTLHIWGAPPDSTNWGPRFDLADPSGTFRIEWSAALSSFDEDVSGSGELIPLKSRISNRFTLRKHQ